MDVKLVIVDGEGAGRDVPLTLPAVIGRSRNVGITIAHPLVSRQHCELVERDGQLVVRDLGSLNGTFIGEMRITEELLPPGGLLTVGQVTFQAVYAGFTPEGAAAQPQSQNSLARATSKKTTTIAETIEEPADSKTPTPQSLSASPEMVPLAKATPSDEIEEAEVAEIVDTPKEPDGEAAGKKSKPKFDFGAFSDQPQPEVVAEDDDLNDFLKNLG